MTAASPSPHVLVDADACPVKEEVYKVALRHAVPVTVVSNGGIRIPDHPLVTRVVVPADPDAADDWIAERADAASVIVTADILLAERGVKAGSTVLAPTGKPFTADSIGSAVATRNLMADLRVGGEQMGGPKAFRKEDRSRFLQALDTALVQLKRSHP
jgi:uncharacterized protein YaiI (UPF0178 family)